MLEAQRHSMVLEMLATHGTVSLKMMIREVGASEATLRRDLIKLANGGELRQVRGGAVSIELHKKPISRLRLEGSAFQSNMQKHIGAKQAIARCAVALCEEGEAIIINGGSTTFFMSNFLRNHHLSILTNSLAIGVELIEQTNNRVIFPAGEASRKLNFILNPLDDSVTDAYRASKYFLSCRAVSHKGVMEADPMVALAEQRMAALAEQTILLVDTSKIGKSSNYAAFNLTDIDLVITDQRVTPEQLALFDEHQVQVQIAPENALQSSASDKA